MVYGAMLAKFCCRSQGQPLPGVRKAAMISIRRATSCIRGRRIDDRIRMVLRSVYSCFCANRSAVLRHLSSVVCLPAGLEYEPAALLGLVDATSFGGVGCGQATYGAIASVKRQDKRP